MLTGYYQKNKKCQYVGERNLSKEEKNKKCQYGHGCYENLSEDEKHMLFEYRQNYSKMRKNK